MFRRTLPPPTRAALTTASALVLALAFPRTAHAGPTAAVDLDLGTSVGQGVLPGPQVPQPQPTPLYIVGFRARAGWRFDIGSLWILPEIGGGYDVERVRSPIDPSILSEPLPRVFAGARAGLSLPLAPAVRLEPALYGHVGYAHYEHGSDALANDVGLALDVRFLKHFMIGAHVGYEVVTIWEPSFVSLSPGEVCRGSCLPTPVAVGDKWIGYGVHFGVVL